jgi:hypothetical protein
MYFSWAAERQWALSAEWELFEGGRMSGKGFGRVGFSLSLGLVVVCATLCHAQFSSNLQGFVEDPSRAVVAKATVTLVNTATQATRSTTTDDSGNYRFVSLAPGAYRLTVEASGYAKSENDVTLLTEQNLNVPITLKVGTVTEAVSVTSAQEIPETHHI